MPETSESRLRAMGFAPGEARVFIADARFIVSDLEVARHRIKRSQTHEVPVQLDHDDVVQVVLSSVVAVAATEDADLRVGNVPDWRFVGEVQEETSRFNGYVVRGYAVGRDGIMIQEVYAQATPPSDLPPVA